MQDEPSFWHAKASAIHPTRPEVLIGIVIAAQIVAMILNWGFIEHFTYLNRTVGLSFNSLVVIQEATGVLSQGIAISAWWLAMLVPHSQRSVGAPLTLVLTLILLYSALPLSRAFSNFYAWTVFVDELWRVLAWRCSSVGLQLVCVGGPCYLLSRMGKLQLNRSGDLPQPTTFDVKRIFGLTMIVAFAYAAARWTDSSEPTSYSDRLSPTLIVALSSISYVSLGIGWACLSWASAIRSTKYIALTIAALALLNVGAAYVIYWFLQNDPETAQVSMSAPKLLLSTGHSLISGLGILAAIRIVHYCGYELAFSPQIEANSD